MKAAIEKSNVKVVVADDEALMRGIVLNTLGAGGYRDIRTAGTLDLLRQALDAANPDLLIVSSEMAGGDALDLVRRIRLFRVGRNPFVPIIMMAWNAEQSFVRSVIDSGADVLVTKPFAAAQLYAKIELLYAARPRFVVTSSYFGPDRRKSPRGDDFPSFDVPNTLKDRLNGQPRDREELIHGITAVFSAMMEQRRALQEREIQRYFAVLVDAARGRLPVGELRNEVGSMIHAAKRYVEEHTTADRRGADRRVEALAGSLRCAVDADDPISLQECDAVERLLNGLGIAVPSTIEKAVLCDNRGLAAAC